MLGCTGCAGCTGNGKKYSVEGHPDSDESSPPAQSSREFSDSVDNTDTIGNDGDNDADALSRSAPRFHGQIAEDSAPAGVDGGAGRLPDGGFTPGVAGGRGAGVGLALRGPGACLDASFQAGADSSSSLTEAGVPAVSTKGAPAPPSDVPEISGSDALGVGVSANTEGDEGASV